MYSCRMMKTLYILCFWLGLVSADYFEVDYYADSACATTPIFWSFIPGMPPSYVGSPAPAGCMPIISGGAYNGSGLLSCVNATTARWVASYSTTDCTGAADAVTRSDPTFTYSLPMAQAPGCQVNGGGGGPAAFTTTCRTGDSIKVDTYTPPVPAVAASQYGNPTCPVSIATPPGSVSLYAVGVCFPFNATTSAIFNCDAVSGTIAYYGPGCAGPAATTAPQPMGCSPPSMPGGTTVNFVCKAMSSATTTPSAGATGSTTALPTPSASDTTTASITVSPAAMPSPSTSMSPAPAAASPTGTDTSSVSTSLSITYTGSLTPNPTAAASTSPGGTPAGTTSDTGTTSASDTPTPSISLSPSVPATPSETGSAPVTPSRTPSATPSPATASVTPSDTPSNSATYTPPPTLGGSWGPTQSATLTETRSPSVAASSPLAGGTRTRTPSSTRRSGVGNAPGLTSAQVGGLVFGLVVFLVLGLIGAGIAAMNYRQRHRRSINGGGGGGGGGGGYFGKKSALSTQPSVVTTNMLYQQGSNGRSH